MQLEMERRPFGVEELPFCPLGGLIGAGAQPPIRPLNQRGWCIQVVSTPPLVRVRAFANGAEFVEVAEV